MGFIALVHGTDPWAPMDSPWLPDRVIVVSYGSLIGHV